MLARQLKVALDKRFPNYICVLPGAMSTFVDPRYKSLNFSAEQQETTINGLVQYFTTEMHKNVLSSIAPGPTVTPAAAVAAAAAASSSSTSSSVTASASNTNSQYSGNSATGRGNLWDALDNMIRMASSNITSYISSLSDVNMYLSC